MYGEWQNQFKQSVQTAAKCLQARHTLRGSRQAVAVRQQHTDTFQKERNNLMYCIYCQISEKGMEDSKFAIPVLNIFSL